MNDLENTRLPQVLPALQAEINLTGFTLSCELQTGELLRTLAASKPNGQFLELGTGMGFSTCWLLDGMSANAKLTTVELKEEHTAVAKKHLGQDSRVTFVTMDGIAFLKSLDDSQRFDFIFADAIPGKFALLEETLALLNIGGFYVVDDLLPQPTWPEGQQDKVNNFLQILENHVDLILTKLSWASGLVVATKIG